MILLVWFAGSYRYFWGVLYILNFPGSAWSLICMPPEAALGQRHCATLNRPDVLGVAPKKKALEKRGSGFWVLIFRMQLRELCQLSPLKWRCRTQSNRSAFWFCWAQGVSWFRGMTCDKHFEFLTGLRFDLIQFIEGIQRKIALISRCKNTSHCWCRKKVKGNR